MSKWKLKSGVPLAYNHCHCLRLPSIPYDSESIVRPSKQYKAIVCKTFTQWDY